MAPSVNRLARKFDLQETKKTSVLIVEFVLSCDHLGSTGGLLNHGHVREVASSRLDPTEGR